jgi:hypothetical protein
VLLLVVLLVLQIGYRGVACLPQDFIHTPPRRSSPLQ